MSGKNCLDLGPFERKELYKKCGILLYSGFLESIRSISEQSAKNVERIIKKTRPTAQEYLNFIKSWDIEEENMNLIRELYISELDEDITYNENGLLKYVEKNLMAFFYSPSEYEDSSEDLTSFISREENFSVFVMSPRPIYDTYTSFNSDLKTGLESGKDRVFVGWGLKID